MICPKCKAEMPDSAAYCIQCGAELPAQQHPARPGVRGNRARSVPPQGGQAGQAEPQAGDTGVVIGGFRFDAKPGASVGTAAGAQPGRQSGTLFGKTGAAGRTETAAGKDAWTPPAGYASPLQRLGAVVLDFLILGAGVFFMLFVLALILPGLFESQETSAMVGQLMPCILGLLYYAGMESSQFQATPGKLALGFKVTDLQGRRISFSKAVGRHFAKILSFLFLFAGYLMIFFTRRHQGLHDILAGCLAVRRSEGESTSGAASGPGAGFRA